MLRLGSGGVFKSKNSIRFHECIFGTRHGPSIAQFRHLCSQTASHRRINVQVFLQMIVLNSYLYSINKGDNQLSFLTSVAEMTPFLMVPVKATTSPSKINWGL